MFFNKQIFFYTITPNSKFKIPPSPCATHFGKLSKFAKVFLEHFPKNPTSPTPPTSPKSPIKSKFFSPNLQRRISEGSAKESRRAGAAEYVKPVRLAPPLARACSSCPIQNSKFKIQNSKFFSKH